MDEQEVKDLINLYIVTNHNNEITAAILNPILIAIVEQSNDLIGNLNDLITPDNIDLVEAINSVQTQINAFSFTGVQVYSGVDDPNDTPPLTFAVADFYKQLDGGGNTIALFQYNGTEWVNLSDPPYVGTLQEVTDEGSITTNPIIIGAGTDNISYETNRIVRNKDTFETRITFENPTGNYSANVRVLTQDEEIAFLSDINAPAGNVVFQGKGWVGTTANVAAGEEVGDIYKGSFFDAGESKWYWYPQLQWLGGDKTDIANFNWSYRDDFI